MSGGGRVPDPVAYQGEYANAPIGFKEAPDVGPDAYTFYITIMEVPMDEELDEVLGRFDSVVCDDEQLAAIARLRGAAKALAALIVEVCPQGRNKARALTHLEDSSVCAIKAVAHGE